VSRRGGNSRVDAPIATAGTINFTIDGATAQGPVSETSAASLSVARLRITHCFDPTGVI
jgi:hypothetical protein